ncbi:GNAT family N-acetyltransferase [Candidatus Dojkabacteria bacterium]|nr:GNAT family N-acetyltransferase [Candidatus Dojkabacteria bacterium]
MNLEITRVNISNWEKLRDIRLEALKYEPEAFSSSFKEVELYPDQYWKDMILDKNNIILLALVDGITVGMVRAALKDEDVDENTAFIGSLYVRDNYRRMGIGKRLMEEIISIIWSESRLLNVRLWVNDKQLEAIELYKSIGFIEVGEEIEGRKREIIFEKRIRL